jgi:hypothetical protein
MESKKCRICLKEYLLSFFYKHNKTKDGLFNECKNCIKNKSKKYHEENNLDLPQEFIDLFAKYLDAGSSLESSLPLIIGNISEELS